MKTQTLPRFDTVETTSEVVTLKTYSHAQFVYLNGREVGWITRDPNSPTGVIAHPFEMGRGTPKRLENSVKAMWYLASL